LSGLYSFFVFGKGKIDDLPCAGFYKIVCGDTGESSSADHGVLQITELKLKEVPNKIYFKRANAD